VFMPTCAVSGNSMRSCVPLVDNWFELNVRLSTCHCVTAVPEEVPAPNLASVTAESVITPVVIFPIGILIIYCVICVAIAVVDSIITVMAKDVDIQITLNKDDADQKVQFTKQSMAKYPPALHDLDLDTVLQDDIKMDRLAAFRSEINFWLRDNCEGAYLIEAVAEKQGLRVYFASKNDCIKFERVKETVVPPKIPDFVKSQY